MKSLSNVSQSLNTGTLVMQTIEFKWPKDLKKGLLTINPYSFFYEQVCRTMKKGFLGSCLLLPRPPFFHSSSLTGRHLVSLHDSLESTLFSSDMLSVEVVWQAMIVNRFSFPIGFVLASFEFYFRIVGKTFVSLFVSENKVFNSVLHLIYQMSSNFRFYSCTVCVCVSHHHNSPIFLHNPSPPVVPGSRFCHHLAFTFLFEWKEKW